MSQATSPVLGIVPAAGRSRRMGGQAKPLLDAGGGETFLDRVVSTFRSAGVGNVVVGVREDPGPVAARAREAGARVLVPADVDDGPIATIREALSGEDGDPPAALLVLPADMPLVHPGTVARLLEAWGGPAPSPDDVPTIWLPRLGERTGHPALFTGQALAALRTRGLEQGARTVVEAERERGRVGEVPVEDRGILVDIDTLPDYRRHFPQAFRRRFQKW